MFLPVLFSEVSKSDLAVAIPPNWQHRRCHPTKQETYIQVRAACAETGLKSADVVVAIGKKVPKLRDCYEGTELPFQVVRNGEEITVNVSTFPIDRFHSKTVVICHGMVIEDVPIQIGMTTRSKTGKTLYVSEIEPSSLADAWEIKTPCFLKKFNKEDVQTTDDSVKQLKAQMKTPEGMSFKS